MHITSPSNQGDTIVEVLIAILIVSFILAGAYVTTSYSLTATRQAQERSEALKLVAGQAEQLKSISTENPLPTNNIFNNAVSFCINSSNVMVAAFNAHTPMGMVPPIGMDSDASYTPAPTGCVMSLPSGSTTVSYDLSIDRCDNGDDTNDCANIQTGSTLGSLFIIRARWDQAGGGGRDEATLIYRVYPFTLTSTGMASVAATPPTGGNGTTGGLGSVSGNGNNPNPSERGDVTFYNDANLGYPAGRIPISCYYNWGDGGPDQPITPTQCRSYTSSADAIANGANIHHGYCSEPNNGYPADTAPGAVPCDQLPACTPATENTTYPDPPSHSFTVELVITDAFGVTTISQPTAVEPACF